MSQDPFTDRAPKEEGGSEQAFKALRVIGAVLGLVLILCGVVIAFQLLSVTRKTINDPTDVQKYLDKWEGIVRGQDELIKVFTEVEDVTINMDKAKNVVKVDSEEGSDDSLSIPPITMPQPQIRVQINFARILSIFILIILLMIIVRITFSFIGSGIKLISLATTDDAMIKKILKQAQLTKGSKQE